MLEEIAHSYVNQSEEDLRLIGYAEQKKAKRK